MKNYIVTWEERFRINIKANSKKEAEEKWEKLGHTEKERAYQERVHFEIEE